MRFCFPSSNTDLTENEDFFVTEKALEEKNFWKRMFLETLRHTHLIVAWVSQNKLSFIAHNFIFMFFSLISTLIYSLELNVALFLICKR